MVNFLTLGTRLAHLRKQAGLSQQSFAAILGVSQATVAKHEKDVNAVTASMLLRYANFFDVSADYLLCRTHHPVPYAPVPPDGRPLPPPAATLDSLCTWAQEAERRIAALEDRLSQSTSVAPTP